MSIQTEDVIKIAHLARVAIAEENTESYARDLSNIMDLVEQMQTVDTSGVEPMAHPLDQVQRLRADVVLESNKRETFQAIAPEVEDGLFLVPQVID